jgi:hypothetical protein
MKTIFAPLTAAVVLATIVSMADHLKSRTTGAGLTLPGTAMHAVARQWGKLSFVPVRATVNVLHHVVSGFADDVGSLNKATDGHPHVLENWPCP